MIAAIQAFVRASLQLRPKQLQGVRKEQET